MDDEIDKSGPKLPNGSESARDGGESSSRRGFLKTATVAIGGVIGAVLAYPSVRYVLFPVGRKTVSESADPIDVMAEAELVEGAPPIKVKLVGDAVKNAWSVSGSVALGSAWIRKRGGKVEALSAVCPHLGCAIDYDPGEGEYKCPCHRSSFAPSGEKKSGPAKRGLDPLPTKVNDDGRVEVTFLRFKQDVPDREPA